MTAIVHTIGHSNHPVEEFAALLNLHRIEVVADVRSHPSSRFAPQFNSPLLRRYLHDRGFRYVYLGQELGGRPSDGGFYDSEGYVLYGKLAESRAFLDGIMRLENGVRDFRVAVMCAEEDPRSCHRRLLVGRVMAARGFEVSHLRGNGRMQSETSLETEEARKSPPTLFPDSWRSVAPVARKTQGAED